MTPLQDPLDRWENFCTHMANTRARNYREKDTCPHCEGTGYIPNLVIKHNIPYTINYACPNPNCDAGRKHQQEPFPIRSHLSPERRDNPRLQSLTQQIHSIFSIEAEFLNAYHIKHPPKDYKRHHK